MPRHEEFMFDSSAFSGDAIDRLRALCGASGARTGSTRFEKARTMSGRLVEGIVACRRLPNFVKQVLRSEERLRLYSTVQAQVEGKLILQLDRDRRVKVCRRTSKDLSATILESAELARAYLTALSLMLSQTKKISYDFNKTIHFYFFTRTTANSHKAVRVPFFEGMYRLQKAHRPERGSVYQRLNGHLMDGEWGIMCTSITSPVLVMWAKSRHF
uniref:Uncharacterized protein n=1 Tax=Peronospora matthiolae TaxID=2874970 RepID=A0AAV1TKM3_9STRA